MIQHKASYALLSESFGLSASIALKERANALAKSKYTFCGNSQMWTGGQVPGMLQEHCCMLIAVWAFAGASLSAGTSSGLRCMAADLKRRATCARLQCDTWNSEPLYSTRSTC